MSDAPQASPSIGQQYLDQVANGGSPTSLPQPAPSGDNAAAPAVTPTPAVQPAPAQPTAAPDPAAAKHQAIGKFFQNFVGSGSGSSASQFFRSVVASAILGMGAGSDRPVVARGSFGDVRDKSIGGAAARGFAAGSNYAQQQQDRAQQQAKQVRDQAREDQQMQVQLDDLSLRKAADARAQIRSVQEAQEHSLRMQGLQQAVDSGNYDAQQRVAESAQKQTDLFNSLQIVGAKPLTGQDGNALQFDSMADAEKAAHDNPKFFIGDFKTRITYNPSEGKYEIYKLPDQNIKNVVLTDSTGAKHTIPEMSPSEYLDFQSRQQSLQKGKLEIAEIQTRLGQMRNETKASSLYGAALGHLNAATDKSGTVDLDKLSAGDRSVLYEHSAKGLEDSLRVRAAANEKRARAVAADDQDGISEAEQELTEATALSKHFSSVLSILDGKSNPKASVAPASPAPTPAPSSPEGAAAMFRKEGVDKQKAEQDKVRQFNERPAEPPVIVMGNQSVGNPKYNDSEAFLSQHPEFTPAQRAAVRAEFQKGKTPTPQNGVQAFTDGGNLYHIPADQVSAFKAAHPNATASE